MGTINLFVPDDELEQTKEDLRFIGAYYMARGIDVRHQHMAGHVSMARVFNELVREKLAQIEEAEGIKE